MPLSQEKIPKTPLDAMAVNAIEAQMGKAHSLANRLVSASDALHASTEVDTPEVTALEDDYHAAKEGLLAFIRAALTRAARWKRIARHFRDERGRAMGTLVGRIARETLAEKRAAAEIARLQNLLYWLGREMSRTEDVAAAEAKHAAEPFKLKDELSGKELCLTREEFTQLAANLGKRAAEAEATLRAKDAEIARLAKDYVDAEEEIARLRKALQNVDRLASDLPDLYQAILRIADAALRAEANS